MLVAEVILPLPLDKTFHYAVPSEYNSQLVSGMRVLVQFGKRKEYAALVVRILEIDEDLSLKFLISVLDEYPVVLEHQLLQWKWMASYYLAPIGDVMNAALPPGLKLSSQSVLVLDPGVIPNETELSDSLFLLYEALKSNEKLTLDEVRAISQIKNPMPLVQKALEQGWAILEEELKKVARAKRRKLLRISPDVLNRLDDAFSATSRSEKQTQALLSLVAACGSENKWIDSRAFRKKKSD